MVHLSGAPPRSLRSDTVLVKRNNEKSDTCRVSETSTILFLRPDLVNPSYKNAEPLPARDQKHRVEIAKASNWPGYWGSPGFASATAGASSGKSVPQVGSSLLSRFWMALITGR